MSLGLFNLMTLRDHPDGVAGVIADTREMVRLAEEIGFDIAWFAEHHFTNYSVSVSPLMMAAHMAGYTTRIKLGAGVVVLPLYHPLRVSQEIALLDQQTGGRAVLGVGTGYQKYEFERFGADVDAKVDVFLEYWSVVEQALAEGRVSFDGRYIKVPDTVFTVRPVQKPLPPVFVTSPHPQILARVKKWGGIPFVTAGWRGSAALPGIMDQVKKSWTAGGLDSATMPLAVQQYIHVTDSRDEARDAGERARYVARLVLALRESSVGLSGANIDAPPLPDEPPIETFVDNLIIGDAHHVAERIVAEFRQLRPVHYNCFFQFGGMPLARARKALERFGKDVLPLVEKEVGPLRRFGARIAPVAAAE